MMALKKSVLFAATILALGACSKKPPADLPTAGSDLPDDGSGYGNGAGTIMPGSQEDFMRAISSGAVMSDRIFFDTDKYNVDSNDAQVLDSQIAWLNQNPTSRITIEGHADERGTREYNIGLGERRANSAKDYLVSRGVNTARINVISYGKERPVALGSTPEAWAQNRRAVTVVVGQ